MDPTDKSIISFPFDFPPTSDSQPSSSVPFASVDNSVNFPFDGFPQVQSDFTAVAKAENGGAETDHVAVPRPLECLQGNPVPPFLTKTYDLVEDPSLDPIISWGERGDSFVVWEPADFAKIVLPRNFKHANFSSFVRQLNTYGFRKIDANKWEFANGFFLRGSKHLLKKIRRRRLPQQVASEATGPMMETELEKLRMDKSVIMQEMVELQHQHRETAERMETIKRRLQVSELRQKSMVSLVAKAVQNPELIEEAMEMERLLSCSARTRRKIVKQESQEQGCQQSASMDEQVILNLESPEMLNSLPQHYLLQESMLFQTDNVSNELVASQDVMGTPLQTGGCGASTPANRDFSSLEIGSFVDYPEDLATGMVFSEFPVPVKEETLSYVSSSTVDSWSTVADYNYPVAGNSFSGGLLANWNLSAIQETGNYEIEKWKTYESTIGGCGSKDL